MMPVTPEGLVDRPPRSHRLSLGDRDSHAAVRHTLLLLGVLDAAVMLNAVWLAQGVVLVLLLTLPGYLALRALRIPPQGMVRSPGWLPSAGIVVLTATALTANLLGPIAGVDRPLGVWPLTVAVNAACLGMSALPGPGSPFAAAAAAWRALDRPATWALLVPALAGVATLRLNNGHGDPLPTIAATAAVVLLAVSLWRAPRWSTQRLCWTLTSASLALLLGYSLRSDYVFGWDISAEYHLIESTISEGVWATSHPGDAYGAMLSLTALPALLHSVGGLSGLVLLKLIYPVLFSLVPAVVLVMLSSVLSPRVAFVGATLLLTQLSFISEMPALARQEIALLLFVSLLAVLVDGFLGRRQRLVLLIMLTAGVVVSHYSTTYALTTLAAGAVMARAVVARRHGASRLDPRTLVVLATALVLGIGWYQGVTKSTDHAVATVGRLVESGLQILPTAPGETPLEAYLRGPAPVEPLTVEEYQARIEAEFARNRPWVVPVADAAGHRWALRPPPDGSEQVRSPVLRVGNLAALMFSQLLVLVTVAGTAVLALRRRVTGQLLDFAILAVPSIGMLGLARVSTTIADSYGQNRLYLQLLPIVAVPFMWALGAAWAKLDRLAAGLAGSYWSRLRWPLRRWLVFGVSAYLILLVAMPVGLVRASVGDRSAANLFAGGEHYSRFYVTAPEVAAAEWLGRMQEPGSLTYADGHAQLRIFGYGVPKGVILTDITPGTVDVNAWVYASRINTVRGATESYFDLQWVVYAFPRDFLIEQFGVAYTNGSAEVFHR